MVLFHVLFLLCLTVRPKIMVLSDLFLLFVHDHLTKIYVPFSFIPYFPNDHSTKIYGPLSFILSLVDEDWAKI